MTWLAWRQIRTQSLVLLIGATALAAVFLINGDRLEHKWAHIDDCIRTGCDGEAYSYASNVADQLVQHYLGEGLLYALPAFLGILWGAPLVAREITRGTYRTAWTQSVTRRRWLTTRLLISGGASIVVTAILAISTLWWVNDDDQFGATSSRFSPQMFDIRGLVPIGYAAFAFALGVLAGVVWRRTGPAALTTLAGYIGTRIVVTGWVRPHLESPHTFAIPLSQADADSSFLYTGGSTPFNVNSWILSTKVVDAAGRTVHPSTETCYSTSLNSVSCTGKSTAYLDRFQYVITYQPATRYWQFQIYETLIYLGLTALLVAVAYVLFRRRSD